MLKLTEQHLTAFDSKGNTMTKFSRAEYFANRDFSPLQPYSGDYLAQQVAG